MATPGRGGAAGANGSPRLRRRLGCEEPRESGVSFRYPGLCSCPLGRQRPRTRNPRLGTDPSGPTGCRPQPKVTTGLSSSGVSSRLPAPWLSPGRPLLPTAIQRGLRIGGAKRSRCWSFWHCRCPLRLCGVVQLAGRKTQAECHQDRTGAARKLGVTDPRVEPRVLWVIGPIPGTASFHGQTQEWNPGSCGSSGPSRGTASFHGLPRWRCACRVSQFPDQRLNGCPGAMEAQSPAAGPGSPRLFSTDAVWPFSLSCSPRPSFRHRCPTGATETRMAPLIGAASRDLPPECQVGTALSPGRPGLCSVTPTAGSFSVLRSLQVTPNPMAVSRLLRAWNPGGRPRLRHGAAGAGGGRMADPRLPYSLDQRAVLPECLLQDHGQGARDMAAGGFTHLLAVEQKHSGWTDGERGKRGYNGRVDRRTHRFPDSG
ncbi:uncharacterized protein [Bos taurus]|uniref:uncharacterized protein n=1 Tax=Bos taurus TaxID=9913 RepID=UPI00076095F5|nr:uncharacterized protein LOC101903647 [Bos taurus]